MDEQRIQAYVNLIKKLLNSLEGNESEILIANRELVDVGLLQIMAQVAEQRAADGEQEAANFLRNLSQILAQEQVISGNVTSANPLYQYYLQFLRNVLQATADSQANYNVIYPLLQANLDKLNYNFITLLQNWPEATNLGMQLTTENIAGIIGKFSNFIQQFPLGSKAINIEISIAGYEACLKVFKRDVHPENWAGTQMSLGYAYNNRICGNKAENLEMAIAYFNAALQVLIREKFPQQWADIQTNLGYAYFYRIRGDRRENFEEAIAFSQRALEVYLREEFPNQWAMNQMNLGNAYQFRIQGDIGTNIQQAIAYYQQTLEVINHDKSPNQWAEIQICLGAAYSKNPRGDRNENIEQAIAYYEAALSVLSPDMAPDNWAMTQMNLGNVYSRNIEPYNMERAIVCFQSALEVYTRDLRPYEWAVCQMNLGLAYLDRIQGKKLDNQETAIEYFSQALQFLTINNFPYEWASTKMNLGIAYLFRIREDSRQNLERAIGCFEEASQIYIYEDLPYEWVKIQNNLGIAYSNRIEGDRTQNLERAITYYQEALRVYTSENFPSEWAKTQNNLGLTYFNRILGRQRENLEMAIACYQESLKVRTPDGLRYEWATTQINLGLVYSKNIRGEQTENLEQAINCYQNALTVLNQQNYPDKWALTKMNLAAVYLYRITREEDENLEQSIAYSTEALQVYNRDSFPQDWAKTQGNIGIAYSKRIRGDRGENLRQAIAAYEGALEIFTPEADPINCLNTSRRLGDLHFIQNDWQSAITAYEKAITAVELSRSWAISDDHRQKVLAEAIDVYQKLVQAYLNTEQWDKALETVERSKTRNLVELLANRELYPKGDVPQEIINELDRLRSSIPSRERQLRVVIDRLSANTGQREEEQRRSLEGSRQQLQQELQTSRQQLDRVLDRIKPIDPSFTLTQRVEPIAFSDIQALMDDRSATIEWYLTEDKIITFILTANSLYPLVEQASAEKREALENWGNDYLAAYSQQENQQWKDDLAANLKKLAEILNIEHLLNQIEEIFDKQGGKCDRLVLVPYRFLHLLPLHALPLANGDLLMDCFPRGLSYAPSMQLLQLIQTWSRPSLERFFSVKNPTKDLSFADVEVDTICRYFHPNARVLTKQQASKRALASEPLDQTNVAHFSCHGYFDFKTPSQSALLLTGSQTANATVLGHNTDENEIDLEKCLTLGDILALDLRQCRLVVLSACETGISDSTSISDEYISLPSGFLYAGSPGLVSSLWTVSDFSTAFLMIKFYDNLRSGDSVTVALSGAQLWLRNVTKRKLEEWIKETQLVVGPSVKMTLQRRIHQFPNEEYQPFSEPFYWAAFCAIDQ